MQNGFSAIYFTLGIVMTRLLVTSFGIFAAANIGAQTAAPLDAMQVLHKTNASVNWDPKSKVVADISCDGVADTAVVGYEKDAVWLGVVFGSKSQEIQKPLTQRFEVGKQTQASFCAVP